MPHQHLSTPVESRRATLNPSFSGREFSDSGRDPLRILQLNVEGWSTAKCEILQSLISEKRVNVVLLQETHQLDDSQLKLHGFTLADYIPSAHHGIATFVSNALSFAHVANSEEDCLTQWTTIAIAEVHVSNVYHPPAAVLDSSRLPAVSDQFIISGDFNCRHEIWGYPDSNHNGDQLANWCSANDLTVLFDPKQPSSFHSGRWNRGTNPDVTFTTNIAGVLPTREILGRFPRSQHRPSLITTPPLVSSFSSKPVPRWNFRKADWEAFTSSTEEAFSTLPVSADRQGLNSNYLSFTTILKNSAKTSIPRGFRKSYIPTWDTECDNLYRNYLSATDATELRDLATRLIDRLDEKRKERWEEAVANIDFTHSSRKAWQSVNRLTGRSPKKSTTCPLHPNVLARRLVANGKFVNPDKVFNREVRNESALLSNRPTSLEHAHLNEDFRTEELTAALSSLKLGKAPGPDGVHNEFLVHLGPLGREWLRSFMNACFSLEWIPRMWRRATVVSLLKPGKPVSEAPSYRPISLLCSSFKLLERVLLNRIYPIIDPLLPPEQSGFRKGRATIDQVALLTQKIEEGFDQKQIIGAVFLDLTAAYDTVWHRGLRLKLQRHITSEKLTNFIMETLASRSFVLYTDHGQSSKPYRLKNGVAQGSVLAPLLYNLYTADLPYTLGTKYIYADDVALTVARPTFEEAECALREDLLNVISYMQRWRLKVSASKTVASVFHLRNYAAGRELRVALPNGQLLPFESNPKYLGVTLDRSLTFLRHCRTLKKKVNSRVALLHRLAGTNWGACFSTLRISALALAYSAAEYCAPVWCRSSHAALVDVPLNDAMRLISGCLRSTPLSVLPHLAGIQAPRDRRDEACLRLYTKAAHANHPLHQVLHTAPTPSRLRSRRPLRPHAEGLVAVDPPAVPDILQPYLRAWNTHPPGHHLPRRAWVQLNRLRSGVGRFAALMSAWGLAASDLCSCGRPQTAQHVLQCDAVGPPCPLTDLADPRLLPYLLKTKF